MRSNIWVLLVIGAVILIGAGYVMFSKTQELPTVSTSTPATSPIVDENEIQKTRMPLTITSSSFQMNGTIPTLFTCDGKNISPELNFSNIPKKTQSFVLIIEDPDVPKNVRADGMWNHWIVWNIPPQTTQIGEGKTPPPSSIVGINTSNKRAYAGPCPPDREHHYIFTLYALDSLLSINKDASKGELLVAMQGHVLEKAELIGRYDRNR
jgi:hypothetical protein